MRENPLIIKKPTIVNKGWGFEEQIINNDMYCSKILHFLVGTVSSLHYHIDKHETWFLANGIIKIKGINPDTAEEFELIVNTGEIIDIPRGTVHQVIAMTDADIFEVSTPDSRNDNYRIGKGDSQK